MDRLIRWLPWALSGAAVLLFSLISPSGLLLAAAWGLVILTLRFVAALAASRQARVGIGIVFAVGCFLAAFEGGWYLLPAAVAFIIADRRGDEHPAVAIAGPQLELIAGVMAAIVGWLALAIIVWGPLYESRSSVVGAGLPINSGTTALSLAAAGVTGRTAAVLVVTAVLFAVIGAGAIIHVRLGRRWAHRTIGLATLALAAVSVLGALSIGPLLLPGLALAILAWWSGRSASRQSTA